MKTFNLDKNLVCQVFNDEEEYLIKRYLIKSSQMFDGLTAKGTCQFVYSFTFANSKDIPQLWHTKKQAVIERIIILKRSPNLRLRTLEVTSMS